MDWNTLSNRIFRNKRDILSTFDFIHRAMSKDLKDQKDTGGVKAKILNLAFTYVNSYEPTKNSLRKLKIFKKLRNNNNILITKSGKGDGAVIVDRIYNMSSIYEIVNDTSKFLKLRSDPTICPSRHTTSWRRCNVVVFKSRRRSIMWRRCNNVAKKTSINRHLHNVVILLLKRCCNCDVMTKSFYCC